MECNKEEAIRAKEIAEKKMLNNDFLGARKMVLKAKNLFPELDNISQLLAVCDVHCSAQNTIIGSEKDWYGILQTEKLSDEAIIKKQYRKLALVLHPDKNKFPGAEAAFKLIGEANMVLSDKGKRSLYDVRCRVSVKASVTKPPAHQVNPVGRNSQGVQRKIPTAHTSQFSGLNHPQATRPDFSNGHKVFWTCCPFCFVKYQYYRKFVNKSLRCQTCSTPFIAYELGSHDATPVFSQTNPGSHGSNHGFSEVQPSVSQQKQVPSKSFNIGEHCSGEFPSYNFTHANSRKLGTEYVTKNGGTTEGNEGLNNKDEGNARVNSAANRGVKMSLNDTAKARVSGNSRAKYRKRGRKLSENCNATSSSDSKEVVFEESSGNSSYLHKSDLESVQSRRRSSRPRQNVSYNENAGNDDPINPLQSSHDGKSNDFIENQKEPFNSEEFKVEINKNEIKRKSSAEESPQFGKDEAARHQVNVKEDDTLETRAKKYRFDDSEAKTNLDSSDPEVYECQDPEFSDFDKDKGEKCFSVDQIWACYDTIDGMPRFYAQVKKVFSHRFKLQITWLEAAPSEQNEIDWVNEGLPVGCGIFTRGDSEETSDHLTFSHLINWKKGIGRGSYLIYPRKGETWALFKDWDIGWSSDSENHKKYTFQIVEILSDFSQDTGIKVGYLAKVKGFVSLFQRTVGVSTCMIPSSEILRFSHRIPSFEMTGAERDDVPEGSFELDPASLPTNPNELWQSEVERVETESTSNKMNSSSSNHKHGHLKSLIGSDNTSTPKKCVDFEGKNNFDTEAATLRKSPRELNSTIKRSAHAYSFPCASQEGTSKHLNGSKILTSDLTPSKKKASSSQGDEQIHFMVKSPIDVTESPATCPSFAVGARVSEEVFYNFKLDKSVEKFKPGQIWALYGRIGKFPNSYAQVKKIEPSPFKVYAVLLEACTLTQPVCCGMFKVPNAKPKVFSPNSFSHLMKCATLSTHKHEIYPKEGDIWAIYKHWNAESSFCDPQNCGFDVVEVLKANESGTEVSPLVHLPGFKSVFKARRRPKSNTGLLTIPRGDLFRFSHQIPAFQLTSEKDGYLKGCWELDPAALPNEM